MSEKLTSEYINLTGHEPCETTQMLIDGCPDPDNYHWEETGVENFPIALVKNDHDLDDPFAPPEEPHQNIGLENNEDPDEYVEDEFSIPDEPSTQRLKTNGKSKHRGVPNETMRGILNPDDRAKLLVNHNPNSAKSARHILDGFTIERLIEAYAEGLSNEDVCRYLHVRPGQLKSWLAMSQQRMAIVSRMKDIIREQKVDKAIDESLDYEVGDIFDKSDEAYERLKLEAMKMRSKNALDLDKRSRGQDKDDGGSLPVVNLGLQVNMSGGDKALDSVKPVIPGVSVIDPD